MAGFVALAEVQAGFLVVWGCRQQEAPSQGSGGRWEHALVNGAFMVGRLHSKLAGWNCLGGLLSRW